jgi:hypothetical protein
VFVVLCCGELSLRLVLGCEEELAGSLLGAVELIREVLSEPLDFVFVTLMGLTSFGLAPVPEGSLSGSILMTPGGWRMLQMKNY